MSIFGIIKTVASKGSSYIDEQIEKEKRKSIERADERQRLRAIEKEAYEKSYRAAAERRAAREGQRAGREIVRKQSQPTRTIQAPTVQSYGFGAPNWEGYNKMFAFPTQQQPKRTKSKRKPKLLGYDMWNRPIYR